MTYTSTEPVLTPEQLQAMYVAYREALGELIADSTKALQAAMADEDVHGVDLYVHFQDGEIYDRTLHTLDRSGSEMDFAEVECDQMFLYPDRRFGGPSFQRSMTIEDGCVHLALLMLEHVNPMHHKIDSAWIELKARWTKSRPDRLVVDLTLHVPEPEEEPAAT